MSLSVRSVGGGENEQDMLLQLNIANNEMAQDLNTLKDSIRLRESEIAELKQMVNSLNVRLGEFSASKGSDSVRKKQKCKNMKFGATDETTVGTNTLFKSSTGSLVWSDDGGVQTVIVA